MKILLARTGLLVITLVLRQRSAYPQNTHNPIILADVPDMAMIRVGDTYYMSITTMHGLFNYATWQPGAMPTSTISGLPIRFRIQQPIKAH